MNVLKIIGRVLLILLMIPTSLQLLWALLGVVAAANQKPEAISYMIGRFVGALLFLIIFIWLFRKLGKKA